MSAIKKAYRRLQRRVLQDGEPVRAIAPGVRRLPRERHRRRFLERLMERLARRRGK